MDEKDSGNQHLNLKVGSKGKGEAAQQEVEEKETENKETMHSVEESAE